MPGDVFSEMILPYLGPDGFPIHDAEIQRCRELMRPVVFVCLTDKLHPAAAPKRAFENLELLESLYTGDISVPSFVDTLTESEDIVLSDAEDPHLVVKYMALFYGIMSACAIARHRWGFSIPETIEELAKHDIWSDIACNGKYMSADDSWSMGDAFIRWMYKPKGYMFTAWDEVYGNENVEQ